MKRQLTSLFSQFVSCSRIGSARRGFSFTSRNHKVKISYAIYPEGRKLEIAQKSPIFVLHGMFGSKNNWHSLAKRITSATHRQVVTLDARNHGDSGHISSMDYLTMRDDLLGVMDTLKVERPILLGHSMGGKTVMACALSSPERVESLIVVDIAPEDSPSASNLRMYVKKMTEIEMPSPSASLPEARRQVGNELKTVVKEQGVLQFLLANLKQSPDNTYTWRVNLAAILDNFDSLLSFPQFSAPCTNVRTIFIGGANSQHIGPSAERSIHRQFPGAAIEHVPEAGHWVHSEKPTQFVDLVQKFVLSSSPRELRKNYADL